MSRPSAHTTFLTLIITHVSPLACITTWRGYSIPWFHCAFLWLPPMLNVFLNYQPLHNDIVLKGRIGSNLHRNGAVHKEKWRKASWLTSFVQNLHRLYIFWFLQSVHHSRGDIHFSVCWKKELDWQWST